jgi:hypothetical protein
VRAARSSWRAASISSRCTARPRRSSLDKRFSPAEKHCHELLLAA